MNFTPILNIVIKQGSDLSDLVFQLRHKTVTRCQISASTTPAEIKIEQLGVAMVAGEIITIGCDDLELSEDLSPTSDIVNVTSIPSSITRGAVVTAKPINITGWSFNGSLKNQQGTLLAEFTCSIVDANDGRFRAFLAKQITTDISSNCTWRDYQGLSLDYLGQPLEDYKEILSSEALKRLRSLNENAYVWDLESVDDQSLTQRRVEGLALVSGEVST